MKITKIIREGNWVYDNLVTKTVKIIEQNWDNYYEEGYSEEPPDLNEKGLAYYVVFGEPNAEGNYSSISRTFLSLSEAIQFAENSVEFLKWHN